MQEQNKVFDVINPDGARPLILTCEHASAAIPSGYDNLGLSPMWLDTHIARDKNSVVRHFWPDIPVCL